MTEAFQVPVVTTPVLAVTTKPLKPVAPVMAPFRAMAPIPDMAPVASMFQSEESMATVAELFPMVVTPVEDRVVKAPVPGVVAPMLVALMPVAVVSKLAEETVKSPVPKVKTASLLVVPGRETMAEAVAVAPSVKALVISRGVSEPEVSCQLLPPVLIGVPFIMYCPAMSTLPPLVTVNLATPEAEAEIKSPVLVWFTVRAGQPAAEVAFTLVRPSTAT